MPFPVSVLFLLRACCLNVQALSYCSRAVSACLQPCSMTVMGSTPFATMRAAYNPFVDMLPCQWSVLSQQQVTKTDPIFFKLYNGVKACLKNYSAFHFIIVVDKITRDTQDFTVTEGFAQTYTNACTLSIFKAGKAMDDR